MGGWFKRKKPLCALCGESLVRKGFVTYEETSIPGKPLVGWHTRCYGRDKVVGMFDREREHRVLRALGIISKRGTGRVLTVPFVLKIDAAMDREAKEGE